MADQGTIVAATAEFVGGPMDGLPVERSGDEWPEFQDLGLEFHEDPRRVLYRFEPLACGKLQYVFDRRYNR